VRFDDRLMTVLAQPSSDPHDCAVRWRQLVDLLARAGRNPQGPLIEQALAAVRADWERVSEPLRAAAARAIADRPLPLPLLAAFASDSLAIGAPVLAAARLSPAEWQQLLGEAGEEARKFIASLHSELQPPPSGTKPEMATPAAAEAAPPPPPEPIPSISDVLARIERLRQSRERETGSPRSPPLPQGGSAAIFRWECNPSGEIEWVEGAPRGALIGRSIARSDEGEGVDRQVQRAFDMRAPFRDAMLSLGGEGPISGEWKISGIPAFEPTKGRFAGYRGVAMRPMAEGPGQASAAPRSEPLDAASLRELVHEIKTPLNAIIGFAEIIDGQLLGPADRHYRERAAEIVRQAGLLLAAIDDLDTAAKLQLAHGQASVSADLAEVVGALAGELGEIARSRNVNLDLDLPAAAACSGAIDPNLAQRVIRRFLLPMIGAAGHGEQLRLRLESRGGNRCSLSIDRPSALRQVPDAELLGGAVSADRELEPALVLALRLVRGLARIAGGDLVFSPDRLALELPKAREG